MKKDYERNANKAEDLLDTSRCDNFMIIFVLSPVGSDRKPEVTDFVRNLGILNGSVASDLDDAGQNGTSFSIRDDTCFSWASTIFSIYYLAVPQVFTKIDKDNSFCPASTSIF